MSRIARDPPEAPSRQNQRIALRTVKASAKQSVPGATGSIARPARCMISATTVMLAISSARIMPRVISVPDDAEEEPEKEREANQLTASTSVPLESDQARGITFRAAVFAL